MMPRHNAYPAIDAGIDAGTTDAPGGLETTMPMPLTTYIARNSDGALNLFCGEPPFKYAVNAYELGGREAVAYRADRGCSLVASVNRRELFPDVRLGQCKEVRTV